MRMAGTVLTVKATTKTCWRRCSGEIARRQQQARAKNIRGVLRATRARSRLNAADAGAGWSDTTSDTTYAWEAG
jgi:hypothetical protein